MSPPLRDGVIYAGVPVNFSTFDRFNYMVLLRINQAVLCSGALIRHKGGEPFVITAKHCVDGSQDVFEIYACTHRGYWNGVLLELYTNELNKNAVMYLEDMTESPNANDLLVTRRDLTLIPLKNKSLPTCASTVSTYTDGTPLNPSVTIVGYGWDPTTDLYMQITSQLKYMENREFQFYESQADTTWYRSSDRTIQYLLKNEYHMNAARTGIRAGDSGGPAIYNGNVIGVASYQRGSNLVNPSSTGHVDITNQATIAWFDQVNAITNHTPVSRLTSTSSAAVVPRVSAALFCTLFFLTSAMMVFTS